MESIYGAVKLFTPRFLTNLQQAYLSLVFCLWLNRRTNWTNPNSNELKGGISSLVIIEADILRSIH